MFTNVSIPTGPEYYSTSYRLVGTLVVASIFLVGCAGNVLVVLVVCRCRGMYTPTNCYLVSLAAADVLFLVFAALPTLVEYHLAVDEYVLGAAGCSFMVFVQYLGVNASSLSITALTVERYIAVCHPLRAQTVCTVRRAKRIIVALWAFGVAYSAPWLALTTTVTTDYSDGTRIESCTFKLQRARYLAYFLADLVLFYVVPLVVNSSIYGLIAATLYGRNAEEGAGKLGGNVDAAGGSEVRSRYDIRGENSQALPIRETMAKRRVGPVIYLPEMMSTNEVKITSSKALDIESTKKLETASSKKQTVTSSKNQLRVTKEVKMKSLAVKQLTTTLIDGLAVTTAENHVVTSVNGAAMTSAENVAMPLQKQTVERDRTALCVNSSSRATSGRLQVIKMLAVLVVLYAVLWLPYRVYVIYNSFASVRIEDEWFLLACRSMVYVNSAINPILYNAMSVKFRRAFGRLLGWCGPKGRAAGEPLRLLCAQTAPTRPYVHVTRAGATQQRDTST